MGLPGSRKTTLLLQFPDVHIFDCDQNLDGPVSRIMKGIAEHKPSGTLAVPPLNPNLSFTFDSVRKDPDSKTGDMLDISKCFQRLIDLLALAKTQTEYRERKVFGLDSLSHVNEFIIRKVLKNRGKEQMEMLYYSDFASGAYTLLVAKLDQINKPVICTCHLELITEAAPGNMMQKIVTEMNPLFTGRVGDNLGAFFTDVWLLETRIGAQNKVESWLCTDRTPKCKVLKNSLGMPREINVTEGFKAIEKYVTPRL